MNKNAIVEMAEIFLEQDLENPVIESLARAFLRHLKEIGHEVFDPEEDDGCLACLHLSLMDLLGDGQSGWVDIDCDDEDAELH